MTELTLTHLSGHEQRVVKAKTQVREHRPPGLAGARYRQVPHVEHVH